MLLRAPKLISSIGSTENKLKMKLAIIMTTVSVLVVVGMTFLGFIVGENYTTATNKNIAVHDSLLPINEVISESIVAGSAHIKSIGTTPQYGLSQKQWDEFNLHWAQIHFSASEYLKTLTTKY